MRNGRALVIASGLALLATSCGLDTVSDPTSTTVDPSATTVVSSTSTTTTASGPDTTPPSNQVYVADGTVLDKQGVGPQLCTFVRDSLPPQCDGLPVVGLNWGDIPWAETAGDTTWADARLVGTFNGSELVLTEQPAERGSVPHEPTDFSTPCPVPDDGWVAREPAIATEQDFERANEYAQAQPGYSGTWVDHLQEPSEGTAFADAYIANFAFTVDLDQHRAAIEQLYGGPLCVSGGKRPLAELQEIQDQVFEVIFSPQAEAAGIYAEFGASGGASQFKGVVELSVMAVVGDEAQAWLDDQFGVGSVVLHSFLRPYESQSE